MLNLSFHSVYKSLSHSLYPYGFSLILFSFSVFLSVAHHLLLLSSLTHIFTGLSKTSAYREKKKKNFFFPSCGIWNRRPLCFTRLAQVTFHYKGRLAGQKDWPQEMGGPM